MVLPPTTFGAFHQFHSFCWSLRTVGDVIPGFQCAVQNLSPYWLSKFFIALRANSSDAGVDDGGPSLATLQRAAVFPTLRLALPAFT